MLNKATYNITEANFEINPLLEPDSAVQFGKDFSKGKLTDTSLILNAFQEASKKLDSIKLMVNLALLYIYAPSLPDIMIACNQIMVDLANKSEPGLGGTSAYKIVYMLYQSLYDKQHKLRADVRHEIIEDIMNRLDSLIGNDRDLAQDLRRSFAKDVKDLGFTVFGFSEEWNQESDPEE